MAFLRSTRVTVTVEHNDNDQAVLLIILMGLAFVVCAGTVLPAIGVIAGALATAIIILAVVASVTMAAVGGAYIYVKIRDRPVYEAMQRDTQMAIASKPFGPHRLSQSNMKHITSQPIDNHREIH